MAAAYYRRLRRREHEREHARAASPPWIQSALRVSCLTLQQPPSLRPAEAFGARCRRGSLEARRAARRLVGQARLRAPLAAVAEALQLLQYCAYPQLVAELAGRRGERAAAAVTVFAPRRHCDRVVHGAPLVTVIGSSAATDAEVVVGLDLDVDDAVGHIRRQRERVVEVRLAVGPNVAPGCTGQRLPLK